MQSFLLVDRGPQTEAPQYLPFPRFGAPQDHRLSRSKYYTTTVSAARLDRHERSPFEPYERGDLYSQQLRQAACNWELAPQRTTFPPVYDSLAASASTDRPREQLEDEIELLSARLERAKALKAAAAAPSQQAVPTRRNAEPPTRYGSLYRQYGALYNIPPVSFSSQALGAPVVASVASNAHADALLVERDFSPNGVRITDFPRQSRSSAAAPASSPLASTLDSAAA